MVKTKRKNNHNSNNSNNKTKKICSISLKSFEKKYSIQLLKKEKKSLKNLETLKKEEFAKELLYRFAPLNIKPNNDFYDYIDYLWIKNLNLSKQKKYIVQVDDFRLQQDKVYKQLNNIILNYIKDNNNRLSKNLNNYYQSILSMNPKSYSRKLAYEAINKIDDLINRDNPWELLAFFNKDYMISPYMPFNFSVNSDNKDPNVCRCYIEAIQFPIVDLSIYYDDGKDVLYKERYRKEYIKTIQKYNEVLFGKNNNLNPKDSFDVQVQIFDALGCTDVTNKEKSYNRVSSKDSIEKYGFDFNEFSKQLGFKKVPVFFITSSLNYLKCGTK